MPTTIPRAFEPSEATDKISLHVPPELNNDLFFRRLPMHGTRNNVLGQLLKAFHQEIIKHTPEFYDESSERIATELLRRISFDRVDRETDNRHDRRRAS